MKKAKITISDNGIITVPTVPILMTDFEIAELFGVFVPTVKTHIRTILKSNIITADLTGGATLVGNNILPDYYGLEMITALAFRIHSKQAEIFRGRVLGRLATQQPSRQNPTPLFISLPNGSLFH